MIENVANALQMQMPIQKTDANPAVNDPSTPYEASRSFSSYLKNAVDDINRLQSTATQMNYGLLTGQVQDMHQVMIAGQKATLALDMAVQVRNKAVEAYQEIMRMQV
ncbi:flagellar hook-basal body complex protein FliE [Aneurinibacillus terranovensis]|uniref:flagellar hook-basal body complex protein FliE n=1 Tax=Aneurinibacillus terranovensis TaxID=278991 RepID=UPI000416E7CF|nr:flagellar hook-basal body complex protein FliE [Aneurinibacillus terranovensis]